MFKVVQVVGFKMLLVLGGFIFFIDCMKVCLNLDYIYVNMLEVVDGKFIGKVVGGIVNVDEKCVMVECICCEIGVELSQVIVMGDGVNDLCMMGILGLLVVFCVKLVVCVQVSVGLNFVGLDGILNLLV